MIAQDSQPTVQSHPMGSAVHYLPLVQRIARRLARRLPPHVCVEDLISAGVVGLLEAMQRFDTQRATEFASYAEFRIKGAILDELRRGDMMARDARTEMKRIESVMAELSQHSGCAPSEEMLAQALGVTLAVLHRKLEKLAPVRVSSFDDLENLAPSVHSSPFEAVNQQETRALLAQSIEKLSERQRQVLHLYYIEELTLRDIGKVLEVTESRICQILAAATLQLRVFLKERKFYG